MELAGENEQLGHAPHSQTAEIAVLGSMLLDAAALDSSLEQLVPGDFYLPANQDIFACMAALREKGAPVDSISLITELDRLGKLRQVGDVGYITDLTIKTISASESDYYINLVTEHSMQRQLIRAGNLIARDAMDSERDIEQVLSDAERRVYDITLKRAQDSLLPVQDSMYDTYAHLGELMTRQGQLIGVSTGFVDLDRKTSGLKKSDLIIIAGRPAMGKTSLALNLAQHAALREGRTVVVFSLEMGREQLITRIFSSEAEVDMQKLITGTMSESELIKVSEVLEPLGKSRLFIDDSAAATVPEIRSKCRRLKARHGLDLLVIDYLQLMRSQKKTENRQQEVSDITRSLKILARELDVPIVLLSQLSREPEKRKDDHRPLLSDLRESGAIEQDADIVLLLYRGQVYDEDVQNIAEVNIAKHRNGPTGTIELCWFGEYTKFKSLLRLELK